MTFEEQCRQTEQARMLQQALDAQRKAQERAAAGPFTVLPSLHDDDDPRRR